MSKDKNKCVEHLKTIDKFIGHNAKFDAKLIKYNLGIDLKIWHDTMYLCYMCSNVAELETNRGKWLGLKHAAMRDLEVDSWDIDLKTKKSGNADVGEYLKYDLLYTRKLFEVYGDAIDTADLPTYNLMLKAANAYKDIELNGMYLDQHKLNELISEYNKKSNENMFKLQKLADINYCSPKQLQELLFEKLDLPIVERTKKGAASTGVSVLKELSGKHEVVDLILEKRNTDKALAFLKDWKERTINGRLYANFNLHTTITGRTSCNNPNLQQVPRNKELKSIFCAPEGYDFIQMDYSQIELRFAAMAAGVEAMIQAYKSGEDLHTNMAKTITGKEEITKADRTGAKAANFGYLYGMIAKTFVEYAKATYGLDVSLEDATTIRNRFFDTNKELLSYYKKVEQELMSLGFLTNLFGRRYKVDFENLKTFSSRNLYTRKGINFTIQSAASDFVLMALVEIHNKYKDDSRVKIVGTVHDSILFEIAKGNDDIIRDIKSIMEGPRLVSKYYKGNEFPLPIVADVEVGPWGKGEPWNE